MISTSSANWQKHEFSANSSVIIISILLTLAETDNLRKIFIHVSEDRFLAEVKKHGIEIDTETLSKSYRCSPSVASFVRDSLGIEMGSQRMDETRIIFVENQEEAINLIRDDDVIKLVYQNSKKMNFVSMNWGASKGLDDFYDICIILNTSQFEQTQNLNAKGMNQKTLKKL